MVDALREAVTQVEVEVYDVVTGRLRAPFLLRRGECALEFTVFQRLNLCPWTNVRFFQRSKKSPRD